MGVYYLPVALWNCGSDACSPDASKPHNFISSSSSLGALAAHWHFLWTISAPCSSYSSLVIHFEAKVVSEQRVEPPHQTE